MNTCFWIDVIPALMVVNARVWFVYPPIIHNHCFQFLVNLMCCLFCHTLTLKYHSRLHTNMADDAILMILSNHGDRLTSIESDVHDIRTGIQQIKDGPMYALDRQIKRKVAQTGGLLGLLLLAFTALIQ